jgi:C1A family cysteine protease
MMLSIKPPLVPLAQHVDLRVSDSMPDVLDQGQLGSCVANALSNSMRYCIRSGKGKDMQPSRLYMYYFTRFLQHTVGEDSGASSKRMVEAVAKYGACDELVWPYVIADYQLEPSVLLQSEGELHAPSFKYSGVKQDETILKTTLSLRHPIICGILVYSSFESDAAITTGDIPTPNRAEEELYGGHCILLIGYDDSLRRFIFQNSWGVDVGKEGYFTIPYDYILNPQLASDMWIVTGFL